MKQIVLIISTVLGIGLTDLPAHNYSEGEVLTVMATSGLRLRMSPNMESATIHILRYGDTVVVSDTYGFGREHADRIAWMDGHWIKVRFGNISGYVFDSFLSTLPAPTHENQLCIDCSSVTIPFDRYLADNYTAVSVKESTHHREDLHQFVTVYHEGITATRTAGEGWYQLEVSFDDHRLCEILNLMRSMMVDPQLRRSFEESLIFREDHTGHVNEVEITLYPNPIKLTNEHGKTHLSSMVITDEGGC
ncbi:MAG: SH3 domain-containing protein [Saprospiraceae bacterium]|nr:SH3 domain-containing protein [Saprospiraceae bacterium]